MRKYNVLASGLRTDGTPWILLKGDSKKVGRLNVDTVAFIAPDDLNIIDNGEVELTAAETATLKFN